MLAIIGLMSGTSADGIDAALIHTDGKRIKRTGHAATYAYRPAIREAIYVARKNAADYLVDPNRRDSLVRAITDAHAEAVTSLKKQAGNPAIDVIGFHGQTVYHNPVAGRTIQLGDGTRLARLTETPVIYDFRAADMEAGGQGAPLAPIYHQLVVQQAGTPLPALFINIGGVANASFITDTHLEGYDIGPGNALIDDLARFFIKGRLIKAGRLPPLAKFISHLLLTGR